MSILNKLKENQIKLPIGVGQLISYIPYGIRPYTGNIYKLRKKEISVFEYSSDEEKKNFIFSHVYNIVKYAISNISFYKEYYYDCNFRIEDLKCFSDITKIPIINKKVLLKYSLDKRSNAEMAKYIVNTGGSSGHTLSFYVQPSSIGHEWAHMHTIWEKLGFVQSDLKLCFSGRGHLQEEIEYDFARHTLLLDMYSPISSYGDKLKVILKKHPCKYLHGYPSALYELALYCRDSDNELRKILCHSLKGAFLGSEYPYSLFRKTIEETFDIPTISWYGHTERCVLAYEKKVPFCYYPFQTYGFTEAIDRGDGTYGLVGTSYYNYASPLIRYDTEDSINSPQYVNDILESFEIEDGRKGQFIIDKNGSKISLTGLIFGRHHKLFNHCSYIQIAQKSKGEATILYVQNKNENIIPEVLFDSENININFHFERLESPIKTPSGKINLLIEKF